MGFAAISLLMVFRWLPVISWGPKLGHDDLKRLEAIEHRHVDLDPEGEREEVRQIFQSKGFSGEDLTRLVALITSDRARWVRTMLTEEYGLPQQVRSPWLAAVTTFSAFLVCGVGSFASLSAWWARSSRSLNGE